MTKIYLAHSGAEKEQGKWIQEMLIETGYEVINPFDKENPYIHDLKWIDGKVVGNLSKESCEWIVDTDLNFIDESDIVVMIYPNNQITIGTPCEMMYAHLKNKPIYMYVPDEYKNHPWINHMATAMFNDIIGLLCYMELIKSDD